MLTNEVAEASTPPIPILETVRGLPHDCHFIERRLRLLSEPYFRCRIAAFRPAPSRQPLRGLFERSLSRPTSRLRSTGLSLRDAASPDSLSGQDLSHFRPNRFWAGWFAMPSETLPLQSISSLKRQRPLSSVTGCVPHEDVLRQWVRRLLDDRIPHAFCRSPCEVLDGTSRIRRP